MNDHPDTAAAKMILAGRMLATMSFEQKVWAVAARIPKGRVATYGDLARALNCQAYRAVGQAMNHNPYAPDVPCHRVVGSDGRLTGYARGLDKKIALLKSEGVEIDRGRIDLSRYRVNRDQLTGRA